jgi:hypothetical protein
MYIAKIRHRYSLHLTGLLDAIVQFRSVSHEGIGAKVLYMCVVCVLITPRLRNLIVHNLRRRFGIERAVVKHTRLYASGHSTQRLHESIEDNSLGSSMTSSRVKHNEVC